MISELWYYVLWLFLWYISPNKWQTNHTYCTCQFPLVLYLCLVLTWLITAVDSLWVKLHTYSKQFWYSSSVCDVLSFKYCYVKNIGSSCKYLSISGWYNPSGYIPTRVWTTYFLFVYTSICVGRFFWVAGSIILVPVYLKLLNPLLILKLKNNMISKTISLSYMILSCIVLAIRCRWSPNLLEVCLFRHIISPKYQI